MKIDRSDRRLLMWTGLILMPIIIALALLSSQEEPESQIPSSYSAQRSGAKAAYLFLKEEGYDVQRWEDPPDALPLRAQNTTLVLAGPVHVPSKEEKNALQLYLSRGGRILATGYWASTYLPEGNAIFEPLPGAVWKEYQPQVLSSLTRAGAIKMSPGARWGDPRPSEVVHYADDGKGIVVSYKVGKGEVIWWAADNPLTNMGLKEAGNLDLLLYSLGGSKDVQIYWDEYFHSFHHERKSFMSLPVWLGLAQAGLAFLTLLVTYGRRNAPLRSLSVPSRLSPLEFVSTLGSLYRRADVTRTALEVPYNRFRFLLSRRLGLRASSSSAELVRGAHNRLGYADPGLEETLMQVESSLQAFDLREDRVLELVQSLNEHAQKLKLVSTEEQEKTPHANRLQGADPRTK